MFENYSPEERVRKIKRVTEIVQEYRTILNKNIHIKATQAYCLLREKYGQDCPSLRTLIRWRKEIPEVTSGSNQVSKH
jgi:hypothetical protein